MRICKIQQQETTLEEVMQEFLSYKVAQHISERTLKDYKRYLEDFLVFSRNSLNEKVLKKDILDYFAAIPDTSPARYNHPYQNLSCLFNWAIEHEYLRKNPITSLGLKKKRDDGNIKPVSIEDVKTLLSSFDKSTYTGYRNYVNTLKGTVSDATLLAQLPFISDVNAELEAVNSQKQANMELYGFGATDSGDTDTEDE